MGAENKMIIGKKNFDLDNKVYICGILNVTPDSFSDGGKYNSLDKALYHTEEMINNGATIIDVGGESTRPGYTMISAEEEIERVAPVINAIKKRFDTTISLDTYKSKVASAGIEEGADLINDIWGLQYDPDMVKIISNAGVACCLMHNRKEADYSDFVKDYINDNIKIINDAISGGINKDKIILDPGVGFGKTYEQNLKAIETLDLLCNLSYPVLLGTSRKSVVGLTLDLPKDQRLEGTIATNVVGLMKGASIFRVHDVKEHFRALKMTAAIIGKEIG